MPRDRSRCSQREGKRLRALVGVDFFCGIGGATKGLQQAGIRVAKGIDIDERCSRTYEQNCKPAIFMKADIRDLSPIEAMEGVNKTDDEGLIFVACPPCQPFSKQSKLHADDKRTQLAMEFLRFVRECSPDFILMENVPGFVKAFNGRLLGSVLKALDDLRFKHAHHLLDAKKYGVAQTRRRFFLLASKLATPLLPPETHGPGGLSYRTVRDLISGYPSLEAGNSHLAVMNHDAMKLSEKNLARIRATPIDGGDRRSWPDSLWLSCHREDGAGHTDVYGRMHWDEPSPTLTSRCTSLSNGRFGHPEQHRAISVREAASLQGFQDDFVFRESKNVATKHIGNAVPPPLARILGESFISQLSPVRGALEAVTLVNKGVSS